MDSDTEQNLPLRKLPATRVAVVDDQRREVARLIDWLQGEGYVVEYFSNEQDFNSACQTKIFPLQMIDYNLGEGALDGFQVAKVSAETDPWSVRILISNHLEKASPLKVVESFGPPGNDGQCGDGERRSAVTLVDIIGVRHFWACWDKSQPDFARPFNKARRMVAIGERMVSFRMDDAFWSVINDPNSAHRKRMKVYEGVHDFGAQVAEVIRQLAWTPAESEVTGVVLRSNNKGRSRTFVAEMAIECKVNVSDRKSEQVTIHQFIKIGRKKSIRAEVQRALWLAGKVIGDVQQTPKVRRVGEARDLAGIAYEMVRSKGERDAGTLLECIFKDQGGGGWQDKLGNCLDVAFPEFVPERGDAGDVNLRGYYRKRFRNLAASRGHAAAPAANELILVTEAVRRGCEFLVGQSIVQTVDGDDAWQCVPSGVCGGGCGPVLDRLAAFCRFRWTIGNGEWFPTNDAFDPPFLKRLCHGDLHLANVLISTNAGDPWYIDFADTGVWPIAMDVVVMECAFRFQALQYIPSEYDKGHLAAALVCIEAELMAGRDDDAAFENAAARGRMSTECVQWLRTVRAVLKRVRLHAYDRIRNLGTVADQEHINYLYGLLSCALSCAALWDRQEGQQGDLHRAWFAIVVFMLRQEWDQKLHGANG